MSQGYPYTYSELLQTQERVHNVYKTAKSGTSPFLLFHPVAASHVSEATQNPHSCN